MEQMPITTTLTVPNNLAFLPVILAYVRENARKCGFNDTDIPRIELGAEEAITNVIEHAFAPDEQETFDIICQETSLALRIIIKEKGLPFDPAQLPEFDRRKLILEMSDTGLGLHMMKQCLDEVAFQNLGRAGKETHLVKYLPAKPVVDYLEVGERNAPAREAPATGPLTKIDYTVRLMRPEEAVEVSKCAYMSYGYSYTHESIYYPERIRQLNEDEQVISLLAVTASGAIIGHMALIVDEHDPGVVEGGMAFVTPQSRGQGCMKRLLTAMIDEGLRRGLVGIYGNATTSHPYSQKGIQAVGMKECALLLSKLPPAEYKGGLQDEGGGRRSSMYSFKYFQQPPPPVMYVPAHHCGIIEKLYGSLGLSPDLHTAVAFDSPPQQTATSLSIHTDSFMTAKIDVLVAGSDITSEVSATLKRLCAERIETMYLLLNLSDSATAIITAELEHLGFFFAGIMPGSPGKDRLVLQYFNNQIFDYAGVSVVSDMGKELLAYIQHHDPAQN
ncbi:MAG: GNAT family N-acetyltransferase [Deltaproteobacteria bacterium]|nr:GNAT family N-acetyltransferase [Deltaproteobacteria bacterium]